MQDIFTPPAPPALLVIEEAERLRMASLEQVQSIFDAGEIGLILIRLMKRRHRLLALRHPFPEVWPCSPNSSSPQNPLTGRNVTDPSAHPPSPDVLSPAVPLTSFRSWASNVNNETLMAKV